MRKTLGNTGRGVSPVALGCWGISGENVWSEANDKSSAETIIAALDMGINYFDTAPIYGMGHSEEILGKTLGEWGRRSDVHIATKCGLVWDGNNNVTRDLSKRSIIKEAEDSLRRLKTDYIDVYQFHWPNANQNLHESLEAMMTLQDQGKICHFGLTNYGLPSLNQAHSLLRERGGVTVYQGLYNLFERNPVSYHGLPLEYRSEREIIPFCDRENISFVPYSPLFQGLLTGAVTEETVFGSNDVRNSNPKLIGENRSVFLKALSGLAKLAEELQKPLAQLAINGLLCRSGFGPVICGALTAEQIRENGGAMEWTLDESSLRELDAVFSDSGLESMDLI